MRALPEHLEASDEDAITGVICVECPGVVQVRCEVDSGLLRFTCRVGHVFSEAELIEGKEKKIENWLWSTVLGMEELAELLDELSSDRNTKNEDTCRAYRSRATALRALATQARQLIEANAPVDLTPSGLIDGANREVP